MKRLLLLLLTAHPETVRIPASPVTGGHSLWRRHAGRFDSLTVSRILENQSNFPTKIRDFRDCSHLIIRQLNITPRSFRMLSLSHRLSVIPRVILTFIFVLFSFFFLSKALAQAPEKLTYQGVARNSSGETLKETNIEIKFGIHAGSAGGELVWEETHATVTNDFGLFSLMIGDDGATQGGGTLSSFSEIDWASTQYFLNVQLKVDADFIDMGTSEMLSVPYAMFAKFAATSGESTTSYWIDGANVVTTTVDVGIGTPSPAGKLDVQGDGDETDNDPLFQVKRKDGETVFAVYPGGVRINVEDAQKKGTKGGFAVGGFSPGKGLTNDFMYVTPDSVRIYVDETATKGTKGGFAVGGFSPGKGDPTDFVHLTPDNYFIGHRAGDAITTGLYNSFVGYEAGLSTTEGINNVFIGHESGWSNTVGEYNVFIGNSTGKSNTMGSCNIIIGDEAGISNTEGSGNVIMGDWAGYANTEGSHNVFIGDVAGSSNSTGWDNVFIGPYAGWSNTVGEYNVFLGLSAGETNDDGNSNTFIGAGSGYDNVSGSENVFIGLSTGAANTGNNNTFVGSYAGENNVSGENNVFIGYGAGQDEMGSGKLHINNNNICSEPLVYGEFSATDPYLNITAATDITGDMSVTGNMGVDGDITGTNITEISDLRWKTNIGDYDNALMQVTKLRGVTFNWINDGTKRLNPDEPQIGLIAQEVEKVIPELVRTDQQGDKSVNYSKLTVVLLEALKEQQKMIEELQREVELLKQKDER